MRSSSASPRRSCLRASSSTSTAAWRRSRPTTRISKTWYRHPSKPSSDSIADADAVLLATPEYNGSIPGQLKNALDWVSRPISESPIRGKPTAVIGASTGAFGAIWAQRELKKVLGLMSAKVLDVELPVAKADRRLADPDPELRAELAGVLEALTSAAVAEPIAA